MRNHKSGDEFNKVLISIHTLHCPLRGMSTTVICSYASTEGSDRDWGDGKQLKGGTVYMCNNGLRKRFSRGSEPENEG